MFYPRLKRSSRASNKVRRNILLRRSFVSAKWYVRD
jgi:hypothetical protein